MAVSSDVIRRLDLFEVALRDQLSGDVGEIVQRDDITRALFSTDASMYSKRPLAVCYPKTARDVARIVEVASTLSLPILPRGGASSLAGQTVGEAVVLDFTRNMQRVISIDSKARTATVEPGVVLENLNVELAPYGLMVGPDPASANRATIGGMVANNATGTHSIVYGNMDRHVVSVDMVLADGSTATFREESTDSWSEASQRPGLEGAVYSGVSNLLSTYSDTIRRDTPGHWRRNSGYRLEYLLDSTSRNLARVVCGSEGTLGVITEVTLRLVERPAHTALGVVHFATRDEALRSVTKILESGPTAVELLDGMAIHRCRSMPSFAARMSFVEGDPGAVLITEYSGDSREEVADRVASLAQGAADAQIGYGVVQRLEPSEVADVWSVRKEALGLIMSVRGDYQPLAFVEDASVPVEHLASYISQLDEFITSTGTPVVYYAHASAGCLHVRPFMNTKLASEVRKIKQISRKSMELVRALGGAVSSEHGDGLARSWLNPELLGAELYAANRELKRCFDPDGLLNPGKVVDAPAIDADLRYGANYRSRQLETVMDFSADGGFAGAVEQCSGVGACRKTVTGAMCPSYMATNAEQDTTRARANALRAALSGDLPDDYLFSPQMAEVLALCVQCKACKVECPTGVDMAAIKSEWLYHAKVRQGRSLRDRLFAAIPDVSRFLSGPLAPLVNAINRNYVVRALMATALGIDRSRTLPHFSRNPFLANKPTEDTAQGSQAPVALFVDTFNNHNHPEIAIAAHKVLRTAGFSVRFPGDSVCCGRTRISKGDLTGARATLDRALEVLYPLAAAGVPIVGLEPGCLHTFGDEARRLLPGDQRVAVVAAAVVSFEQFVAEDSLGLFQAVQFAPFNGQVVLHGHCHQKALEGTGFARRALERVARDVTVLDTSCCGMAGSFGYEKEHASVSRQMAERRLAPAVRALPADGVVVAAGSSCRSQIRDVAERRALHTAEVLAAALA